MARISQYSITVVCECGNEHSSNSAVSGYIPLGWMKVQRRVKVDYGIRGPIHQTIDDDYCPDCTAKMLAAVEQPAKGSE